jgi:hypothetical protein
LGVRHTEVAGKKVADDQKLQSIPNEQDLSTPIQPQTGAYMVDGVFTISFKHQIGR